MSDTPFKDALSKLNTKEGVQVLVSATKDEQAVAVSATKNLGKGWSVSAWVQWAKEQWAAYGQLAWSPKK